MIGQNGTVICLIQLKDGDWHLVQLITMSNCKIFQ